MLDRIQTHLWDLLQGDARLYAGGTAYAPGWTGVKRPDKPLNPNVPEPATPGWVNLFDESYDNDGSAHRPGVYYGTRAVQATDREEFQTLGGNPGTRYKLAVIPLILEVQDTTKYKARKQRDQLRNNILRILLSHQIESGYWYLLEVLGAGGNGMPPDRVWVASSGNGDQSVAGAMASLA